jgi:hypothetical protein
MLATSEFQRSWVHSQDRTIFLSRRLPHNFFPIGKLYRRGSQAVNHFYASIIFYVLQFIVVVFD